MATTRVAPFRAYPASPRPFRLTKREKWGSSTASPTRGACGERGTCGGVSRRFFGVVGCGVSDEHCGGEYVAGTGSVSAGAIDSVGEGRHFYRIIRVADVEICASAAFGYD